MNASEIAQRIPHSGRMCLLDRLIEWSEARIVCSAISHALADNPLRRGGRLGALCGIEYAAQAMALHGSLGGVTSPRPRAGYLASIRNLVCNVSYFDDVSGAITIVAEREAAQHDRVLYSFSVAHAQTTLLSGRAAVVLEA